MSQVVVISDSSGGKPFSDRRFRYTGPTDGFPSIPLIPSSTLAAKDFILYFFLIISPQKKIYIFIKNELKTEKNPKIRYDESNGRS